MSTADLDILISRVVDGLASPADWDALERHAHADPAVWRALADAQRQHALLEHEVRAAIEPALARVDVDALAHGRASAELSRRARAATPWLGWAVAAALGLAAVSPALQSRLTPAGGPAGQPSTAGIFNPQPVASGPTLEAFLQQAQPSDLLNLYLASGAQRGTVIGEIPQRLVVDSRQAADGAYEVTYIRQIVEKARITDPSAVVRDEAGNIIPVRVPDAGGATPGATTPAAPL
jgi:hypothetical protein